MNLYHFFKYTGNIAGAGWAIAAILSYVLWRHTGILRSRSVRVCWGLFSFLLPLYFLSQLLSTPLHEQSLSHFLFYFTLLCACLLAGAIGAARCFGAKNQL